MNERELSAKLERLAISLEAICSSDNQDHQVVWNVAQELRELSNENYAPGNSLSWDAVKPKTVKRQGGFKSKSGKTMPF